MPSGGERGHPLWRSTAARLALAVLPLWATMAAVFYPVPFPIVPWPIKATIALVFAVTCTAPAVGLLLAAVLVPFGDLFGVLDMGFLPEIRKILRQLPTKRQTFFFSATMPPEIAKLAREMCHDPAQMQLERKSMPAVGITQAVYPVSQELKSALLHALLQRGDMRDTLVFTRTKHRANRLHEYLLRHKVSVERIHGNRSQAQRTAALEGFKSGRHQVLVATDIASRGIDVDTLGHVVNFDVPLVPEDYIHRVGRTARAGATGHAFTFVSPEEESTLKPIERAIGRALPRVTVPDFNYAARPEARLEIPIADRIRAIRARKAEDRARADRNRQRRSAAPHAGHGGGDAGGSSRGRTRSFGPRGRH